MYILVPVLYMYQLEKERAFNTCVLAWNASDLFKMVSFLFLSLLSLKLKHSLISKIYSAVAFVIGHIYI